MSASPRAAVGQLTLDRDGVTSDAGWVVLATLVGVIVAAAVFVNWKLGLLVAIGLIVAFLVGVHPIVVLPVAVLTVFLEGISFGGQPITRLFVPGLLLVSIAEVLRGTARVRFGPPLVWVTGYALWALMSILWSSSPEGTRFMIQSLGIALVFMFAFAALLETEEQLRRLCCVIAFAAAGIGALSVLGFRSGLELPYLALTQEGRSQGGVGDPDFFAAMQLALVPLVLTVASEARNKRLRIALYLCVFPILASVFTSLSRGAFLAVVVLGLLFLISRPERLFRSPREKPAVLLVGVLGLAFFFSRPMVREEVVQRATTIYAPKTHSDLTGSGRTELWKGAVRTLSEHPLVGVGFGSFGQISYDLLIRTPGVHSSILDKHRDENEEFVTHNTYLGTAAELGLVGLVLFLGIIVSTGLQLRRTSVHAPAAGAPFTGRVAHALLLGLGAWVVTDFFLSGETARTFWIFVGLSLALPKLLSSPVRSEEAGSRERR